MPNLLSFFKRAPKKDEKKPIPTTDQRIMELERSIAYEKRERGNVVMQFLKDGEMRGKLAEYVHEDITSDFLKVRDNIRRLKAAETMILGQIANLEMSRLTPYSTLIDAHDKDIEKLMLKLQEVRQTKTL